MFRKNNKNFFYFSLDKAFLKDNDRLYLAITFTIRILKVTTVKPKVVHPYNCYTRLTCILEVCTGKCNRYF